MADSNDNLFDGFEVDHSGGLPVWMQVKNRIAYLIGSGTYAEGDRLPTVRKLAVDLDISYNTVNRAYMDLEREGYISTRKGRGTFVLGCGNPVNEQGPIRQFELLMDEVIRNCREAGMDDESIVVLLKRRLQR